MLPPWLMDIIKYVYFLMLFLKSVTGMMSTVSAFPLHFEHTQYILVNLNISWIIVLTISLVFYWCPAYFPKDLGHSVDNVLMETFPLQSSLVYKTRRQALENSIS